VFNLFGDLERCALRPGYVHSSDGWDEVLKPVVARYCGKVLAHVFPGRGQLCQSRGLFLEAEGIKYAMWLPVNRILQERIGFLLRDERKPRQRYV
jgi:hypothetical protein